MKSDRYYSTPIGELPSVTTVLSVIAKPALVGWSAKVTREFYQTALLDLLKKKTPLTEPIIYQIDEQAKTCYKDVQTTAMDIGSRVHAKVEWYLKSGRIPEVEDDEEKSFTAFVKWYDRNDFTEIQTEQTVWHSSGFAGTLDFCGRDKDGLLTLLDFKTSKAIYDDYLLQVAAYVWAYEERNLKDVQRFCIVRLDKVTGVPEVKEFTRDEIDDGFYMFGNLLNYFKKARR